MHDWLLGSSTPIYDVSKHYQPDDIRDLLIRNPRLGGSLASYFASSSSLSIPADRKEHLELDHAIVLMRGHGYTVAAPSMEECIFRAIYTKQNAAIQTTSLGLMTAAAQHCTDAGGQGNSTDSELKAIQYLHDDELEEAAGISRTGWQRAWELWVREVEASPLYPQVWSQPPGTE